MNKRTSASLLPQTHPHNTFSVSSMPKGAGKRTAFIQNYFLPFIKANELNVRVLALSEGWHAAQRRHEGTCAVGSVGSVFAMHRSVCRINYSLDVKEVDQSLAAPPGLTGSRTPCSLSCTPCRPGILIRRPPAWISKVQCNFFLVDAGLWSYVLMTRQLHSPPIPVRQAPLMALTGVAHGNKRMMSRLGIELARLAGRADFPSHGMHLQWTRQLLGMRIWK